MRARRTGILTRITDARTAAVVVTRLVRHPKYGKTYRRSRTFLVETPTAVEPSVGTVVTIEATRPISKRKHWRIISDDGRLTIDDRTASKQHAPSSISHLPSSERPKGAA